MHSQQNIYINKTITTSPKQWLHIATNNSYDRHMLKSIWVISKSD